MKTIPNKIYEILDGQTDILKTLLRKIQFNEQTAAEYAYMESCIDKILSGCEDIEVLMQAFVLLTAQSTEPD